MRFFLCLALVVGAARAASAAAAAEAGGSTSIRRATADPPPANNKLRLIGNNIHRGQSRHPSYDAAIDGKSHNQQRRLQDEGEAKKGDEKQADDDGEPTGGEPTLVDTATENSTNITNNTVPDIMPGSDRDENGCIPSAGYSWCPSLGECVRPWETVCPAADPEVQCGQTGGTVVTAQVCVGTGNFPGECETDTVTKEPTEMPSTIVVPAPPVDAPTTPDDADPDFVPDDKETMVPTMGGSSDGSSDVLSEPTAAPAGTVGTIEPSLDLTLDEPTAEPGLDTIEPSMINDGMGGRTSKRKLQDDATEAYTSEPTAVEPTSAVTFEPTTGEGTGAVDDDAALLTCPDGTTQIAENQSGGVVSCLLCLLDGADPDDTSSCGIGCVPAAVCMCGGETDEEVAACCLDNPCCDPCDGVGTTECSANTCSFDPPDCGTLVCVGDEESTTEPPVAAPTVEEDRAAVPSWFDCPPEESEEANICECPTGTCFNPRHGCVADPADTPMPSTEEPTPSTDDPTSMPTFVLTGEASELGEGDGSRELPTSGGFEFGSRVHVSATVFVGGFLALCYNGM